MTTAALRNCAEDLLREAPGTVGERVAIERLQAALEPVPTRERLQEIAMRLKTVTRWPWRAKQMNRPEDAPWFFVLDAEGRGPVMETVVAQTKYLVTPEAEQRANVEFIAHAPDDIAYLLNLMHRLRYAVQRLVNSSWVLERDFDQQDVSCVDINALRALRDALAGGTS